MANVLEPPADPLEGHEISGGKFRLERFMGSDDLGRIYLGRHVRLDRWVTIKILHGSHLSDEQLVSRFNRAGLAASRVRHPNVMDVIDLGREPDGSLYLVSEHIDGRNLDTVISQEGPLEPYRVREITMQIAGALNCAHLAGVIHRDLKPENVVVLDREDDDGDLIEVAKVLDFGVAKITTAADSPLTGSATIEMISGKPDYMSPEQCNGQPLDARSDLYALGCLMYFMSTGQPPFSGGALLEVLMKQTREQPAPPSRHNPGIPASLEAVILRLLAKRPDDRYQSARDLRAALESVSVTRSSFNDVGVSIDVDMGDEPASSRDVVDDMAKTQETNIKNVSQRQKKTMIMERPSTPGVVKAPRRRTGSATKVMMAAIGIAIVVGVGAGLIFGQLYGSPEGPAAEDAATAGQ